MTVSSEEEDEAEGWGSAVAEPITWQTSAAWSAFLQAFDEVQKFAEKRHVAQ